VQYLDLTGHGCVTSYDKRHGSCQLGKFQHVISWMLPP
jgi:hypothetical protein